MYKTDNNKGIQSANSISETILFEHISKAIKKRNPRTITRIRSETAIIFWKIGHFIYTVILYDNQAECGMWIFPILPGKSAGSDYV
jgi:hypothetical protein